MVSSQVFTHQLKIPDVQLDYSDENVFRLIEQARLGDDGARELLILGYARLVLKKVSTWCKLFPQVLYLSDDMVSEGLLAVTKAVDALIKDGDPEEGSCTSYIHTAIINNIGHMLEDEVTIRIPRTADEGPVVVPTDDYDMAAPLTDGSFGVIDLMDSLEAACATPLEKQILGLRIKGYTDQEIAEQLDISRASVQFYRAELIQKFERQEAENEA